MFGLGFKVYDNLLVFVNPLLLLSMHSCDCCFDWTRVLWRLFQSVTDVLCLLSLGTGRWKKQWAEVEEESSTDALWWWSGQSDFTANSL